MIHSLQGNDAPPKIDKVPVSSQSIHKKTNVSENTKDIKKRKTSYLDIFQFEEFILIALILLFIKEDEPDYLLIIILGYILLELQ